MSNLPGNVGSAVVRQTTARRRAPTEKTEIIAFIATPPSAPPQASPPIERAEAPPAPAPCETAAAKNAHSADEAQQHWFYATCRKELIADETNRTVAAAGERVVLVYPMRKVGERVLMRCKTIDEHTAQMRYDWVQVYHEDEEYRIYDCSFFERNARTVMP
tara:strand:- start:1351 stop:1833 length:483 start_codon:yes stop_codon:yes gene_type:complete